MIWAFLGGCAVGGAAFGFYLLWVGTDGFKNTGGFG